jgi:hypothetical protein
VANTSPCSDGDACTINDICANRACSGTPVGLPGQACCGNSTCRASA